MVIHLQQSLVNSEFDEGRTRARIFGEVATGMYPDATWSSVEPQMAEEWQAVRGNSPLTWADVRSSAHASVCMAQTCAHSTSASQAVRILLNLVGKLPICCLRG